MTKGVISRMVQAQGESYALPPFDELIPLFQGGGLVLCLGAITTLLFAMRRNYGMALGSFTIMASLLLDIIGQM